MTETLANRCEWCNWEDVSHCSHRVPARKPTRIPGVTLSFNEAVGALGQDAVIALYRRYTDEGVKMWFHTKNPLLEHNTPYAVLMAEHGYRSIISPELSRNATERVEQAALARYRYPQDALRCIE